MKTGSLVVIKKGSEPKDSLKGAIKWMPAADENTIYTIREIRPSSIEGWMTAVFEEGVIGYGPFTGWELGVGLPYLIEIQPPMEVKIEELMSETIEI